MRILITGRRGQLGTELGARLPGAMAADRPDVDVTDAALVDAAVDRARPDLIIHCAAMTNVDGAARDPATADRINGQGTANVARAAERANAALVYVSSNEVFDGRKTTPYNEADPRNPINAYGRSKAAGEDAA